MSQMEDSEDEVFFESVLMEREVQAYAHASKEALQVRRYKLEQFLLQDDDVEFCPHQKKQSKKTQKRTLSIHGCSSVLQYRAASKIQAHVRRFLQRKRYHQMKSAAQTMSTAVQAHRRYVNLREAVDCINAIQSAIACSVTESKIRATVRAQTLLQSAIAANTLEHTMHRELYLITLIQRRWCEIANVRRRKVFLEAVVCIQSFLHSVSTARQQKEQIDKGEKNTALQSQNNNGPNNQKYKVLQFRMRPPQRQSRDTPKQSFFQSAKSRLTKSSSITAPRTRISNVSALSSPTSLSPRRRPSKQGDEDIDPEWDKSRKIRWTHNEGTPVKMHDPPSASKQPSKSILRKTRRPKKNIFSSLLSLTSTKAARVPACDTSDSTSILARFSKRN